jgi:site-specific recombinase XerD
MLIHRGDPVPITIVQALPAAESDAADLLRTLLISSTVSAHTARAYAKALDDFLSLVDLRSRPISRALLLEYRSQLIHAGLSASTINVRLSAIRKIVREARDQGLVDPAEAARITSIPGVPHHGVRLGIWLTQEEAQRLLAVPDRTRIIGKRNYAILSTLLHCGLRRTELATLTFSRIQTREGRSVLADLVGKHGRVRTVPLPSPAKRAMDKWTSAAEIRSGSVFRRMLKSGQVLDQPLSDWAVWDVVVHSAAAAGINRLGPHDLRRSCAKFCREAGGKLEQIQFLLGHAELATTARYLGTTQEIRTAVNDRIHI